MDVPAGSILIVARYDGGRMTCVKIIEVGENETGTLTMDGSGTEYKLMLVDSSYAPLFVAAVASKQ